MGSFRGHHIPDEYQSNWAEVEDQPEYWYWYMLGHQDGYEEAEYWRLKKADKELRQENAVLKGELASLSKTKADLIEEREFIRHMYEKYSNLS